MLCCVDVTGVNRYGKTMCSDAALHTETARDRYRASGSCKRITCAATVSRASNPRTAAVWQPADSAAGPVARASAVLPSTSAAKAAFRRTACSVPTRTRLRASSMPVRF